MTFQNRFVRLAVALSVAGMVSAQIPMYGGAAQAQTTPIDECKNDDSKILGIKTRDFVTAAVIGLVGFGVYQSVKDSHRGGAPAGGSGSGSGGGGGSTSGGDSNKSLYDVTASNSADYSEVRKLIDDADLARDLRDGGPYTFLAPTNGALGGMSPEMMASLRKAENKAKLRGLLSYHIIQGKYTIKDLEAMPDGKELLTLSGETVTVTNTGGLKINGVTVVKNDIAASNGVIHPIEAPLTPPGM